MKRLLIVCFLVTVCSVAQSQPLLRTGWTTNSSSAAARTALAVPSLTALSNHVAEFGLDADAAAYANATGLSNSVRRQRVSEFVGTLKRAGLWNHCDAALLSSNYNSVTTPRTIKLAYVTNTSIASKDSRGWRFDGVASHAEFPFSSSPAASIVYRAAQAKTNLQVTLQISVGMYPSAGTTQGALITGQWFYDRSYVYGSTAPQFFDLMLSDNGTAWYNCVTDPRYIIRAVSWDNAGTPSTIRSYANKWVGTTGATNMTLANSFDRVVLGAMWGSGAYSFPWDGFMDVAIVFDVVLTAAQEAIVEDAIRWLDLQAENWVFVGDSLTGWNESWTNYGFCWPYVLMTNKLEEGNAKWWTFGISGLQSSAYDSGVSFSNRMELFKPSADGPAVRGRAYTMIGINDMNTNNARTGVQTFHSVSNIWFLCRRSGYEVWAATIANTSTNSSITNWYAGAAGVTQMAHKQAFNDMVVSNSHLYDKLIRPDLEFPSMETNGPLVSNMTYDGIHFNLAGNRKMAELVLRNDEISIENGLNAYSGMSHNWTGSNWFNSISIDVLDVGTVTITNLAFSTNASANGATLDMTKYYQSTNAAGNITFSGLTGSSSVGVKEVTLIINPSGSLRTLSIPTSWRTHDSATSWDIYSTNIGVLEVNCYGNLYTNAVFHQLGGGQTIVTMAVLSDKAATLTNHVQLRSVESTNETARVATLVTNHVTAATTFSTNSAANGSTINLDLAYAYTNAAGAVTFAGLSGVDAAKVKSSTVIITGNNITLTVPSSWMTSDGLRTWIVGSTNRGILSVNCYGTVLTNAAFKNFW